MPFGTGISGLIKCAAALELDPDSLLETIAIGGPQNVLSAFYPWEGAGKFLLFTVSVSGPEILVSATLLDSTEMPELLLRAPDSESGWLLTFNFIASLERYEVKSLTRPIISGNPSVDPPETCWLIS